METIQQQAVENIATQIQDQSLVGNFSNEIIAIILFLIGYTLFQLFMDKLSTEGEATLKQADSSSSLKSSGGSQVVNDSKSATTQVQTEDLKQNQTEEVDSQKSQEDEKIPTLYDYNILIKEYYTHKPNLNPFVILKEMTSKSLKPDITTFNTLLHICLENRNYEQVEKLLEAIHGEDELKEFQVQPDIITFNILLKGQSIKLSDHLSTGEENMILVIQSIKDLLQKVVLAKVDPNEITYNTVIDICVKAGVMPLAIHFFDEMQDLNLRPDAFTYSTLLKGFRMNDFKIQDWSSNNPAIRQVYPKLEIISYQCSIQKALEIFQFYKESYGNQVDDVIFNCMIDTCLRMKLSVKAYELFQEMEQSEIKPGTITYGIMFRGYGHLKNCNIPLELYEKMKVQGVPMNEITFGCLIDACIRAGQLQKALDVFQDMKQYPDLKVNTVIYTTLIKGFTKKRDLQHAIETLEEMKKDVNVQPNIVTYNSLLECAVKCNDFSMAEKIYDEAVSLESDFFHPDLITYSTFMKCLCKSRDIDGALKIYELVKSKNFKIDEVMFNTLLDGLMKANELELTLEIYDEMLAMNISASNVTYSILCKTYQRLGQYDKAFAVLEEIKAKGIKVGLIVYTCLLQAAVKTKNVSMMITIYEEVKSTGLKADRVFYNILISGLLFNNELDAAVNLLNMTMKLRIRLNMDVYTNLLRRLHDAYQRSSKPSLKDKHEMVILQLLQDLKDNNIQINQKLYSRIARSLYKQDDFGGNNDSQNNGSYYDDDFGTSNNSYRPKKDFKFRRNFNNNQDSGYNSRPKRKFFGNRRKYNNNNSQGDSYGDNNDNYQRSSNNNSGYGQNSSYRSRNKFNGGDRYNNNRYNNSDSRGSWNRDEDSPQNGRYQQRRQNNQRGMRNFRGKALKKQKQF